MDEVKTEAPAPKPDEVVPPPKDGKVLQMPAGPPKDYQPRCIRFRCGVPLQPGRRGRQFCNPCWSLLPAHLQEVLRAEEDWLRARRQTGAGDHASAMLFAAASRRIFSLMLEADPKMREAFEAELKQKVEEAAKEAAAAGKPPPDPDVDPALVLGGTPTLEQVAVAAKREHPEKKIIVVGDGGGVKR